MAQAEAVGLQLTRSVGEPERVGLGIGIEIGLGLGWANPKLTGAVTRTRRVGDGLPRRVQEWQGSFLGGSSKEALWARYEEGKVRE